VNDDDDDGDDGLKTPANQRIRETNSFLQEIAGWICTYSYKTFKKEMKSLLLLHSFYSVEEFVAL